MNLSKIIAEWSEGIAAACEATRTNPTDDNIIDVGLELMVEEGILEKVSEPGKEPLYRLTKKGKLMYRNKKD